MSDTRFGQFAASYRTRFGTAPPRIATLGYDAVLLTVRLSAEQVSVQAIGLVSAAYFGGLVLGAFINARLIIRVGHIRAYAAYASLLCFLFLLHGMMDDNVPPQSTLLVVDALVKANKDFDLLLLPHARHGFGADSYYVMRRRWDYFVKHLLGVEPPAQFELKPAM